MSFQIHKEASNHVFISLGGCRHFSLGWNSFLIVHHIIYLRWWSSKMAFIFSKYKSGSLEKIEEYNSHHLCRSSMSIIGLVSLSCERCASNFTGAFFKATLQIRILSTFCECGLRRMPQNTFEKSTLLQVVLSGSKLLTDSMLTQVYIFKSQGHNELT